MPYLPQTRAHCLTQQRERHQYKNDVRIRPWNLRNDVTNRELLGPVNRGSSTRNAVKTPDFHTHSAIDGSTLKKNDHTAHTRSLGNGIWGNKAKDKKARETKVMLRRQYYYSFCKPKGSITRPTFIQLVNDRTRFSSKNNERWLTANVLPAVPRCFCSIFCYYLRNTTGISGENKLHLSSPP